MEGTVMHFHRMVFSPKNELTEEQAEQTLNLLKHNPTVTLFRGSNFIEVAWTEETKIRRGEK